MLTIINCVIVYIWHLLLIILFQIISFLNIPVVTLHSSYTMVIISYTTQVTLSRVGTGSQALQKTLLPAIDHFLEILGVPLEVSLINNGGTLF